MTLAPTSLTKSLVNLALLAGREIMAIYATDFSARTKSDLTPVTEADEAAERIILEGLARLDPQTPVISEEAAAAGRVPQVGASFYLVDPLDGTKEFVSRNGEFTVNIAKIENGVPVVGVVYAPAKGRIFWGDATKGAAEGKIAADETITWKKLLVRPCPGDGAIVVASREPPGQRHRRLPQDRESGQAGVCRLLTQVLPDRGRRSRSLSALWPHHGMGYGRWPRGAAGGGRQGAEQRWPATLLRQARPGL